MTANKPTLFSACLAFNGSLATTLLSDIEVENARFPASAAVVCQDRIKKQSRLTAADISKSEHFVALDVRK